jgi:hypothetical protein
LRKAWSLLYRQNLSKGQAYAALTKCDFSSEQVGSLLIAALNSILIAEDLKPLTFE